MRSLRFDLMSCARRLKIPIGWSLRGLLGKLGERRNLLGEGDVDLVEARLELVEVEVFELERGREHDPVLLETEARVDERPRVQAEELAEDLRLLPLVPLLRHVADVDADDDERRVDAHGDR